MSSTSVMPALQLRKRRSRRIRRKRSENRKRKRARKKPSVFMSQKPKT